MSVPCTLSSEDVDERKDFTMQSSGEEANAIQSTNMISLPKSWKRYPTLWFAQIESAFARSKITKDESKFRYVICYVEETALSLISDVIETPPIENKYDELSNR